MAKGLDNSRPLGIFGFELAWLYANDNTKWNFLDIRQIIFWGNELSLAHQRYIQFEKMFYPNQLFLLHLEVKVEYWLNQLWRPVSLPPANTCAQSAELSWKKGLKRKLIATPLCNLKSAVSSHLKTFYWHLSQEIQQCNKVPGAQKGGEPSWCPAPTDKCEFLGVVLKGNYNKLAAWCEKTLSAVAGHSWEIWVQLVLFTDQKKCISELKIQSVILQWEHVASGNPLSKLISPLSKRVIWKKEGLESLIYFLLPNVISGGLRVTDADTMKQAV